MLYALVRKELLGHLASFRFWFVSILTVLLAALSTFVAADNYGLRLAGYRAQVAGYQEELRSARVYSYLQPVAVRPPELLSILDRGFETRVGTDVRIHLFEVPVAATHGHPSNELLIAPLPVDLTTLVAVVLGLLALLLTFDAIAGEKADGNWKALFAHPLRRETLLAGKYLGALLAVSLPLAAALAVSLGLTWIETEEGLTLSQLLRAAGLAGAYFGYLSLLVLLGLLLSLSARHPAGALAAAILVWLCLTLLIPGVAWAVAGMAPDAQELRRAAEAGVARLAAEREERFRQELQRDPSRTAFTGHTSAFLTTGSNRAVLRRYGSASYYDSWVDYHAFEAQMGLRYAEAIFATRQRLAASLDKQERRGLAFAALSPGTLLDRLSESFAGTSVADHDRFLESCRSYRAQVIESLRQAGAFQSWRWFTDDPPGGTRPWPTFLALRAEDVTAANARSLFDRLRSPRIEARMRQHRAALEQDPSRRLDLASFPRFSYQGPTFRESLRRASWEAAMLAALNAAAAFLSLAGIRRQGWD
ncbi:MAG TPA: ABC transporter permease subunit [Thermoanaerobaculia bacterium]|nr:ABC transporter permease subunit [Thermoanaerobaculia bacterium]